MNRLKRYSKRFTWLLMAFMVAALVAGCGDWHGAGSSDTIAPTVTSVTPANTAAAVATNTKIKAIFSESMDPATINGATFTVTTLGGAAVTGVVTYDDASMSATFTPTAPPTLPISTKFAATITTGAKDRAGNALAANYVWTFTTGLTADNTLPSVVATSAYGNTGVTSGATGLPINRNSTATFSEAMDPTTITTTTFTVVKTSDSTPVAGSVSYVGLTATFNPTANLAPNTTYTSTITTGAKDLAGNALAANYTWSWTTGATADIVAPTVTLTDPLHQAINIPLNQKIAATFSEDMKPATMVAANFTVKETLSNSNVSGTVAYDAVTRIATFSPQNPLKNDLDYTVTVTNGATDLAGNALVVPAVAGLPKPNPWTFRTTATIVPPPPSSVNLGAAATYGMAATAGVTNTPTVPTTRINGDVVLNPLNQCNGVTVDNVGGFGLCAGSPPSITGKVATPTYPDATTANLVKAALQAAYISITPLAGPPAAGTLGGGTPIAAGTTLGATTGSAMVVGDNLFFPGVYTSITSILVTGDLTLDAQGDPNAEFIFQSASTVGSADGSPLQHTRILLINGAKASNVWWQAGTSATLGLYSEWQGNILAGANITMKTSATSCGRLFAGAFTNGAFVLDSNVISVPGNVNAPASCK